MADARNFWTEHETDPGVETLIFPCGGRPDATGTVVESNNAAFYWSRSMFTGGDNQYSKTATTYASGLLYFRPAGRYTFQYAPAIGTAQVHADTEDLGYRNQAMQIRCVKENKNRTGRRETPPKRLSRLAPLTETKMKKLLLLTALCAAWCAQAQKPNIVGRVTCKGKPVAGVVVSDGELVVRTDSDGRYEMSSSKPCGYVFMSIPGGYETAADGLIPRFFGYTTHCDLDVIDFQLEKRSNDNFTLFVSTDTHLRGDPEELDLPQFRKWYLPDISREIERTKGPVYSLHLGDMTTDIMWHKNDFALRKYLDVMKNLSFARLPHPGQPRQRAVRRSGDSRRAVGQHRTTPLPPNHRSELLLVQPRKGAFRHARQHHRPQGSAQKRPAPSRNDYQLDERQLRWLGRDLETVGSGTRSSSACTYPSPTGRASAATAPPNLRPKRASRPCTTRSCRCWRGSTTYAS